MSATRLGGPSRSVEHLHRQPNDPHAGFNVSDQSAFWLYINHRAGHTSCLDLTLTAPRDSTRKTAWSYALMQHHTSGTGRGGFGGGLYLGDEAHDAV